MPLKRGTRQCLKREREGDLPAFGDAGQPENDARSKTLRSSANCGRARSADVETFLSSLFLCGRISGPELQEGAAAHAASSGGDSQSGILAAAGNHGKIRGNIHRDVFSKMGKVATSPQVYSASICFWDQDRQCKIWDDCYSSCLTSLFTMLYPEHVCVNGLVLVTTTTWRPRSTIGGSGLAFQVIWKM